jgi:hypothetical protein
MEIIEEEEQTTCECCGKRCLKKKIKEIFQEGRKKDVCEQCADVVHGLA